MGEKDILCNCIVSEIGCFCLSYHRETDVDHANKDKILIYEFIQNQLIIWAPNVTAGLKHGGITGNSILAFKNVSFFIVTASTET